jgi:hypothetical protein
MTPIRSSIAVLLISLSLFAGCSEKHDVVHSRLELIHLGASKEQVEQTLGRPPVIETSSNHVGSTWLAGIAEGWNYWIDGAGRITSRRDGAGACAVYFDAAGKAQYVFAGPYRLEPPRQPIGRELVEHWRKSLIETYNSEAQKGQVARPADPNAILANLQSDYRYPDYSNELYHTMIEVKTASGGRFSYYAELSREPDPWSRTWTLKFNADLDSGGNMIPHTTNF